MVTAELSAPEVGAFDVQPGKAGVFFRQAAPDAVIVLQLKQLLSMATSPPLLIWCQPGATLARQGTGQTSGCEQPSGKWRYITLRGVCTSVA